MHGNEPSKGAKIDKQIVDEEAEIIARMDAKKAAKKSSLAGSGMYASHGELRWLVVVRRAQQP